MKILLLGSGGREHALAWKIAASPLVEKLWCAPGNAGIAKDAECVPIDIADHPAVIDFCRKNAVDFVVVGPDAAIAAGVVDDLNAAGFKAFGPTKAAGRLESSKNFTKALCRANNIPTAAYEHFADAEKAKAYIRKQGAPIVVKADGLAAGKGVVVAMTEAEALDAVDMMFGGAFGASGAEVVIEEFMEGEEASFFALCDGEHALALATAQDHKRAFDGDKGPNTGGMGAYSPAPVMTEAMCARVMDEMIKPTLRALKEMGCPYKGVIFAGIMVTKDGPKARRIQCAVRRSRNPGADAADDVRHRAGADRLRRRAAEEFQSALVRRCRADGDHGDQGLSRRLRQGLGDQRAR